MTDQDDDFTRDPHDQIYDPDADESMKASPDEDPPFTPPTNTSRKKLPPDDPRTDYGEDNDPQEEYDEGTTSATEADTWEEDSDDYEKPVEKY